MGALRHVAMWLCATPSHGLSSGASRRPPGVKVQARETRGKRGPLVLQALPAFFLLADTFIGLAASCTNDGRALVGLCVRVLLALPCLATAAKRPSMPPKKLVPKPPQAGSPALKQIDLVVSRHRRLLTWPGDSGRRRPDVPGFPGLGTEKKLRQLVVKEELAERAS